MARAISHQQEHDEYMRRYYRRDPNSWDMWIRVNELPPGVTQPRNRQIANLRWLSIIADERRRGDLRRARRHLELIERISTRAGFR
jgi:hypothetical protein